MFAVRAVGAVRQEILVLGIGDEQEPEEDRQRLLVDALEAPSSSRSSPCALRERDARAMGTASL